MLSITQKEKYLSQVTTVVDSFFNSLKPRNNETLKLPANVLTNLKHRIAMYTRDYNPEHNNNILNRHFKFDDASKLFHSPNGRDMNNEFQTIADMLSELLFSTRDKFNLLIRNQYNNVPIKRKEYITIKNHSNAGIQLWAFIKGVDFITWLTRPIGAINFVISYTSPEYLIKLHTKPISGKPKTNLTTYRGAKTYILQYLYLFYFSLLHDQITTTDEAETCIKYIADKTKIDQKEFVSFYELSKQADKYNALKTKKHQTAYENKFEKIARVLRNDEIRQQQVTRITEQDLIRQGAGMVTDGTVTVVPEIPNFEPDAERPPDLDDPI